jgi:hypothetical protein
VLPELPPHESRHATIATIAAVLTEYERARQPACAPLEGGVDPSRWRRAAPPGWRGQ